MSVEGAGGGAGSKTLTTTRLALERMPLSFTTLTRPVWARLGTVTSATLALVVVTTAFVSSAR